MHTLEASIMEDGYGKNKNLLYAARAKLDNISAIKSHSCIVNDQKRLKRMIEKLNFAPPPLRNAIVYLRPTLTHLHTGERMTKTDQHALVSTTSEGRNWPQLSM